MRGSNFAATTSLLTATLPAHNAELVGDSLTTLALNFEWRKIIAIALQFWFSHGRDTLAMTNEDYFEALIQDLYNAEILGLKHSTATIQLGANQTRANAAFAVVTGSVLPWTFTKPNAKITISNIAALLSNTTNDGKLKATLSAGFFASTPETIVQTTTRGQYRVASIYASIPTGVSTDIRLEFASAGATTITLQAAFNWLVEIVEWD